MSYGLSEPVEDSDGCPESTDCLAVGKTGLVQPGNFFLGRSKQARWWRRDVRIVVSEPLLDMPVDPVAI